jgi:putative oxidoreductase
MTSDNRAFGLFFLRSLLGVIFLMQGWGKVFKFGIWSLYDNVFKPFEAMLPKPVLVAVLFFTTFAELLGGALLLLGWQRRWAYRFLAAVLLLVGFGHGLESPIWDLQHVVFRALLLAPLFFLPEDWDEFSMDHRLKSGKV